MIPNGSQLQHTINGWWSETFGGGAVRPAERAHEPSPSHQAIIRSRIGLPVSLHNAVTLLPRSATSVIQKKLRQAGFKGAVVEPLLKGDGGGFTVDYQGREYKFWIEESHEGYESNPMLKESDKRVIRSFVNERPASSNLLDTDGVRLDKIGLGGETVAKWVGGRIAIISTESAKSDEAIIRLISSVAGPGVVDFSYARKGHRVHEHGAMGRNGSGFAIVDYPEQDAFIRELQGYFGPEVNERQVFYRMREGALHVTYVNLPRGSGSGGGGAESQNNRMSFDVDGFSSTTYRAMYHGKLKIEQSTTFDRSRKLRAKTGTPSVIARYLADYLNKFAAEVPPKFTHSGGLSRNGIDWERSANAEDIERDFSETGEGSAHPNIEVHFEHDQWWVTCNCGASWSVVDTSRGMDYERIDEGDEDYHQGDLEPNGRASTVDEAAARELSLYIENEYALIGATNSMGKSIDTNLRKKVTKGTYDSERAPRAWQYLIDEGAERYRDQLGDESFAFSAATRRKVATDFARSWEYENKALLDDHDVLLAEPYPSGVEFGMRVNARQISESMQPYTDWSYDDFYQRARDDGHNKTKARLHATRDSHGIGRLNFLPPRNLPKGWVLIESPIFRERDAKPAFRAHKGTKYMVFGLDGKPLSPELSRLRGLIEWKEANGWASAR